MATTVLWIAASVLGLILGCGFACAVVLRLTMGHPYPTFLASKRWPEHNAVPVIMYHSVIPGFFSQELRYLKANGYESISAGAIVAWLNGEPVSLPKRPVILTFDDGLESLWSVAYPLLREYGYQGIAFVCPAWITNPPDLELVAPGTALTQCSWEQLHEMDASGVMDVQCHTLDHHRIWIDGTVMDFIKPGQYLPYVRWDDQYASQGTPAPPLGWPVLPHCQRFAHRRRFAPDREVMRACAHHVNAHGGAAFFERGDWLDEVRRLVTRKGNEWRVPGRWESAEEQRAAMRNDLRQSKELIEKHLGKRVEYLAFPRNEACTLATSLATEVGYRGVFRGPINERDICELGDDPLYIPRVNSGGVPGCYVLSLPGRGRRSPERLFAAKVVDRLRPRSWL